MSSDEETPSLRARARARRSSGSRRMVVGRLGAIQAIYVIQAPMVKPDPYDKSRIVSPNCPGGALSVAAQCPDQSQAVRAGVGAADAVFFRVGVGGPQAGFPGVRTADAGSCFEVSRKTASAPSP